MDRAKGVSTGDVAIFLLEKSNRNMATSPDNTPFAWSMKGKIFTELDTTKTAREARDNPGNQREELDCLWYNKPGKLVLDKIKNFNLLF